MTGTPGDTGETRAAGSGDGVPPPPRRDLAHRIDPAMASDNLPDSSSALVESRGAVPDPGLPPHEHRRADIDPAAEKRAERQVATMFGLSALSTVAFVVAFFTVPEEASVIGVGAQNAALGASLGLALFFIGAAAIQWAKKLMPDVEIVEDRKPMRSTDEAREELIETFEEGSAASGFGRRTMIRGSMLGALGLVGLPAVVLLRDLGPNPGDALSRTLWNDAEDGVPLRIVTDVTFLPLRPEQLEVGTLVNAVPENFNGSERYEGLPHEGPHRQNARAHSAVIMVRMSPDEIRAQQGDNWDYEGILCFSKICTHIGCPINLYEHRTHHLLCPCHQSTFDLANAAKVIFGPAARHLPQLAIGVDDEGYLIATQPFAEAVGPSFWERG